MSRSGFFIFEMDYVEFFLGVVDCCFVFDGFFEVFLGFIEVF